MARERVLIARGEVVVGLDEVGRGSLAGPLAVGAVVLRELHEPPKGLTDSKALSSRQRDELAPRVREWALDSSLGWTSAQEIDEWGLSVALSVAANRAVAGLAVTPSYALIDGPYNFLRLPRDVAMDAQIPEATYATLAHETLVKGDARSAVIAGASVIAKVARDALMRELHVAHPTYGWDENKGYGTAAHRKSIRANGPTLHHRQTWKLA